MTKISQLTTLAELDSTADLLAIVDVSDTTMGPSGTTKKITVQDFLPVDYINVVAQYGADPTGSTDSTVAIQAALTAARTSTYGGTVYLPAGLYIVSTMLLIGSNTTLLGAGMALSTIRAKSGSWSSVTQNGSGNSGISVLQVYGSGASASNITVRGITFDGNQTGITAIPGWANLPSCGVINLLNVTNTTVDACQLINSIGYSLYLQSPIQFTVTNNRVLSGQVSAAQGWGTPSQQDGIHIAGPASNGEISNNFVDTGTSSAGDDGIALQSWSDIHDVVISNNSVRSAAGCVDLALSGGNIYNVDITGNNLWEAQGDGIVIQPFSGSGVTAYNITISGNTIANPGNSSGGGIELLNYSTFTTPALCWSGVTITGNTFSDYTATGGFGIYATFGNDLTITGNTFYNWNSYAGIQIGDYDGAVSMLVSGFTVSNNTIDVSASTNGSGQLGIIVMDSKNGAITGNTIIGNSTNTSVYGLGVYLGGTVTGTTGVSVVGNRLVGWNSTHGGSAVMGEVNNGAVPNNNYFSDNSLHGSSAQPVIQTGTSTTMQSAGLDTGATINSEVYQYITPGYTTSSGTGTGLQKLLNLSTNGTVTLPAGIYFFECEFSLSAMSASSGTFSFGLGGTATLGGIQYTALASKTVLTPSTAQITTSSTAAATALVTASTTTTGSAIIRGTFYITVAGTIIPSFAISVAANAIVGSLSYFRCWPVGLIQSAGWNLGYQGQWS